MAALIDTSLFIHAERSAPGRLAGRRAQWLDTVFASIGLADDEPVALSAISASELLLGVALAEAEHARARAAFVNELLGLFAVVPFGLAEARIHAQVQATLRRQGVAIGIADLQIAATALTHGYGGATLNRRDFDRVPGLRVLAPGL